MNQEDKILIIEDNKGEQELFSIALENLAILNEVVFFDDGLSFLLYLIQNPDLKPFLIISDINLPKMSGLELRDVISTDKELAIRCIPFLFFTTSAADKDIVDAYSKSVQGFFVKPEEMADLEVILASIIKYWSRCKAPCNSIIT